MGMVTMETVWEQTEEFQPKPNSADHDTSLHIAELAALLPPNCIVEGLYAERTFSLFYGPAKSGKTHYVSQLIYDLALGPVKP